MPNVRGTDQNSVHVHVSTVQLKSQGIIVEAFQNSPRTHFPLFFFPGGVVGGGGGLSTLNLVPMKLVISADDRHPSVILL